MQVVEDLPSARACPIGVVCLELGARSRFISSDTLYELLWKEHGDRCNPCFVDGVVAGWEETEHGQGYSPQDRDYTPEENPDGLALYDEGYANGQHIRTDFIKLGLRAA